MKLEFLSNFSNFKLPFADQPGAGFDQPIDRLVEATVSAVSLAGLLAFLYIAFKPKKEKVAENESSSLLRTLRTKPPKGIKLN